MKKRRQTPHGKKTPKAAPKMPASDASDSPFGTWHVVAGEMEEDEARAMVEELYLILNEPEKYSELNRLGEVVGVYKGRKPEEVYVEFRGPAVQQVMARQWHPTELWRLRDDGILEYRLKIAPCWQIKRWVMRHGADAKVMSPRGLQEVIRKEVLAMLKKYEEDDNADEEAK
jgi:predicted DNA-binding transcriptional regulator YafY